jgi:hypothetical protein
MEIISAYKGLNVFAQPEKHSPSRDTVDISICILKWNMSSNKMNKQTVHMIVIEYLKYSTLF